MNTQMQSNNAGRVIGAVVLIALGGFFLLDNVLGFRFDFWGAAWPLFVLVPGLAFIFFALTGGRNSVGLIYPGAIITGTGAILAYQNITNNWESWAYMWTLYPVFVGLGQLYQGARLNDAQTSSSGRRLVTFGLGAFVVFGVFFELILFNDNPALFNIALPVLLIGAGLFLLLRRNERPVVEVDADLPPLPKRKNDADISPALRRKIDEAINEPEPPTGV